MEINNSECFILWAWTEQGRLRGVCRVRKEGGIKLPKSLGIIGQRLISDGPTGVVQESVTARIETRKHMTSVL